MALGCYWLIARLRLLSGVSLLWAGSLPQYSQEWNSAFKVNDPIVYPVKKHIHG
jgi:hypothetical protein